MHCKSANPNVFRIARVASQRSNSLVSVMHLQEFGQPVRYKRPASQNLLKTQILFLPDSLLPESLANAEHNRLPVYQSPRLPLQQSRAHFQYFLRLKSIREAAHSHACRNCELHLQCYSPHTVTSSHQMKLRTHPSHSHRESALQSHRTQHHRAHRKLQCLADSRNMRRSSIRPLPTLM